MIRLFAAIHLTDIGGLYWQNNSAMIPAAS